MQKLAFVLLGGLAYLLSILQWVLWPTLGFYGLGLAYPGVFEVITSSGASGRPDALEGIVCTALALLGWVGLPPSTETGVQLRSAAKTLLSQT